MLLIENGHCCNTPLEDHDIQIRNRDVEDTQECSQSSLVENESGSKDQCPLALLLKKGASVDIQDGNKDTSIICSMRKGMWELSKTLIELSRKVRFYSYTEKAVLSENYLCQLKR